MAPHKSKKASRPYVSTAAAASVEVQCELCGQYRSARGINSHIASCSQKKWKQQRDDEYADAAAEAMIEAQRKG